MKKIIVKILLSLSISFLIGVAIGYLNPEKHFYRRGRGVSYEMMFNDNEAKLWGSISFSVILIVLLIPELKDKKQS